jgi:hypothetical protein
VVTRDLCLQYTHGLSDRGDVDGDEDDEILEVFQVPLNEPAADILSGHGDLVRTFEAIAKSCGIDMDEVTEAAKSSDPRDIAESIMLYAGHWGWHNLDQYPLRMTYAEVRRMWEQ